MNKGNVFSEIRLAYTLKFQDTYAPKKEEMTIFDVTVSVICLVSILVNTCIIIVLLIGP